MPSRPCDRRQPSNSCRRLPPPPPPRPLPPCAPAASRRRAAMLRLLTFNVSGHNVSKMAPPGFSLDHKYERILELVRQHAPHLLSLQVSEGQAPAGGLLAPGQLGRRSARAAGQRPPLAATLAGHEGSSWRSCSVAPRSLPIGRLDSRQHPAPTTSTHPPPIHPQEVAELGPYGEGLLLRLAELGYQLAASTESHCGLTQVRPRCLLPGGLARVGAVRVPGAAGPAAPPSALPPLLARAGVRAAAAEGGHWRGGGANCLLQDPAAAAAAPGRRSWCEQRWRGGQRAGGRRRRGRLRRGGRRAGRRCSRSGRCLYVLLLCGCQSGEAFRVCAVCESSGSSANRVEGSSPSQASWCAAGGRHPPDPSPAACRRLPPGAVCRVRCAAAAPGAQRVARSAHAPGKPSSPCRPPTLLVLLPC